MTKRLDAVASIRTGLVLSRFKPTDELSKLFEYQLVGLRCFGESSTLDEQGLETFESKQQIDKKYLTRQGDILVRLRAPLRAVFVEEEGLLFSSLTAVVRIEDAAVSPKYLLHYLNSKPIQKQLSREIKGTRIPTVRTSDIAALKIVVPPMEEQHKLVGLLETTEREAQLLHRLVEARRELARSALERITTRMKENR